jgi:O-antigen ligase
MQAAPQGPAAPVAPDAAAWLTPGSKSWTAAWLATAAWTGMGVLLWAMFPMTAAVLLPLCAIAPLAWSWLQRRRLTRYPVTATTAVLLLAAAYLLVNASWSLSPGSAARAVVLVFLMVATLHAVLGTLPDLEPPPLEAMAAGALAGLAAAAALLCIEVYGDQVLRRLLMRLVPALQPGVPHVALDGAQVLRLAPYLTNASVSVLALMFWPVALLAVRLRLRAWRIAALVAAAAVAATLLGSEHASSQMAFAGAAVAFVLFRVQPRLAGRLLVAGWVAANLLVVPAVAVLYGIQAYRAPWLPESARHRVVIWHATSTELHKAPLLGAGIGSARVVRERANAERLTAPGTDFQLSPGLHSHNAYLQVWYEAGAVGAFILLGLGLVVLRALMRFEVDAVPYLAATFTAGALLIATAFSIWAPWFMASLAMASIFAALGTALKDARLCVGGRRASP